MPAFSGNAAESRRVNAERVAAPASVLALHGAGDNAWARFQARTQAGTLRKQAALAGSSRPRWTVVAALRTDSKD